MISILPGDALAVLKTLPEQSVQCCITSPPYWGLRNYGVAGQLGLERTPTEYVAKIVEVFREVRRVLKDDGTLWLNLGDAYSQGNKGNSGELKGGHKQATNHGSHDTRRGAAISPNRSGGAAATCKPKDLIGLPWMVAFALRNDGWYLRSDIIWHKINPMPESVTDRPTKAHEYIFLFSKQSRYYYDADAIKEPSSPDSHARASKKVPGFRLGKEGVNSRMHQDRDVNHSTKRKVRGVTPKSAAAGSGIKANESFHAAVCDLVPDRNKRSVWSIALAPFSGAHFATFPPDLIKPCIVAGSRPGDTILDPFFGSGTTGMVALELGRKCVGIELNPEYCKLAMARCDVTPGLALAQVTTVSPNPAPEIHPDLFA